MARYWASCSPGLEFALLKELQNLGCVDILCDSMIFGGVIFSTLSSSMALMKLRSADNVYAFVGRFQDLPADKDPAMKYFTELIAMVDWKHPLDVFWEWNHQKFGSVQSESVQGTENRNRQISFRVTCDRACVAKKKHGFTSMDAAAALGEGIHEKYGWPADMRSYDLEVLAWIRDDQILLALGLLYRKQDRFDVKQIAESSKIHDDGFPVCVQETQKTNDHENLEKNGMRPPRSSRSDSHLYAQRKYRNTLVDTSLKPSVAHALLQLGCILPGNIILDPMCGCGTIPLEAADWQGNQIFSMGGDISSRAIDAAFENLKAEAKLDLLKWDASRLPMRTGCIDQVVCDMPFGIRCGTSRSRESLCPKVLKEISRVLQPGTGVAILLGQSKAVKYVIDTQLKPFLNLLQHIPIHMQGLRIEILVLQRTTEPHL